jgi:hypothetical protein
VSQTAAARDISAEVARIHAAAYEREREPVSTILDDKLAVCLVRVALSRAEELLVDRGHEHAVHSQRDAFEHELAPSLRPRVQTRQ